eukprot:COSAG01_NODE_25583_length_740_cov_1.039002_1_plen_235_part_01
MPLGMVQLAERLAAMHDAAPDKSTGTSKFRQLANLVVGLKLCDADGKSADEGFQGGVQWDKATHGEGTKVKYKESGRTGVSTAQNRSYYDQIQIKCDDDGSTDWVYTRNVSVIDYGPLEEALESGAFEVAVDAAGLRAACADSKVLELELPTPSEMFERAVLERQIAAVWRWADTLADGALEAKELVRVAEDTQKRFERDDQLMTALRSICDQHQQKQVSEKQFRGACLEHPRTI